MPDRSLSEELVRAEVRAELAEEMATELAEAGDRDRAYRALVISGVLAAIILLPLAGLALGVAVRLFGWASGLY
jgi:hypothetical protein